MSTTKNIFGNDFEAFVLNFEASGIPESVVKKVYQFLRRELAIPSKVALCFSDNICRKYGIVDDDLERLAEDLAVLLDRRLPPATMEKTGKPMVFTIEDLILFVWSCPACDS